MRPRKCLTTTSCCTRCPPASMGPRPCGRGNMVDWDTSQAGGNAASMGPRPCGRGNTTAIYCSRYRIEKLQWGRGLAAAEMNPVVLLPVHLNTASMGPRPCGRGNIPQTVQYLSESELQWGRGLAAAEMASTTYWETQPRHASMGPRPCGRGNAEERRRRRKRKRLQWGRGLAAVEMPSGNGLRLPRRKGFNGAVALRPRKCVMLLLGNLALFKLQWGRGLAAAEMGTNSADHAWPLWWLQWGRGLAAAEINVILQSI